MYNAPCVGDGVKRLVSMVHAQQQAWTERVAARHSLLHQMTSQLPQNQFPQPHTSPPERNTDIPSVPPPPSPLSPSPSLSPSPEPVIAAEPPSLSIFSLSSRYRYSSQGCMGIQCSKPWTCIPQDDVYIVDIFSIGLSDRDVSDRDVSAGGVERSKEQFMAISRFDTVAV